MSTPLDPSTLRDLDDLDLLRLPHLAIAVARSRGLVKTWDLPVGGYAEALAHSVLGGISLGAAGVGHDLTDAQGRRVEVKAVAAGRNTSPAHLPFFDALCLVRFDPESLDVTYAVLMPNAVVAELGRPHARGGITVSATKHLPQRSDVEDLTDVFRAAAAGACPNCGASFTAEPREPVAPLLDIVRQHQRETHH